jgi:diguanylate cyclase (GGDEF)-like protein/PAS domain S-box-containing protein
LRIGLSFSARKMSDHTPSTSTSLSRRIGPIVIAAFFALTMSACMLGLVFWKALQAKATTLERGQTMTENLAHSLAEQASHTIQAVDIAMNGVVELLKYRAPLPERLNPFLVDTVNALSQLHDLNVIDANGTWQYSSLAEMPSENCADRDFFIYHRDTPGNTLRISAPIKSRLSGRMAIILTKRITRQDGSFGGVLVATIDSDYFNAFYNRFQLGTGGAIGLMRTDGMVLIRWPLASIGVDLSKTGLFASQLKLSPVGYRRAVSPFDGRMKYVGYEETPQYPLVVTVARSEDEMLAGWRATLRTDAIVGCVLLCLILLSATLLWWQFHFRMKTEHVLREREARYRLLADNIADVVILLDGRGTLLYVSPSVEPALGLHWPDLIGKSCFDLVHPDDKERVLAAMAQRDAHSTNTAAFRIPRADQSIAWVEIHLKLTAEQDERGQANFVGVLRDVTQRKKMEDELTSLNTRLAELATTDGLTGLSNRRTFDGFLRREYGTHDTLSVLLLDIDNFKGYNDTYGHQAGDECLKTVAGVMADATINTSGMSARYGGEEFIIVLPNVSLTNALRVAEAVRLMVRALGIPNSASSRGYVTVSVGVSTRTEATLNETMLVGDADLALYEAKRQGRNRSFASSDLKKQGLIEQVPLQFSLER